MERIKRGVGFIIRQVLALVLGLLLVIGTLFGACLVGAIFAVLVLVVGLFISLVVALSPLLGVTTAAVLNKVTEGLEKATADMTAAVKGNVHQFKGEKH